MPETEGVYSGHKPCWICGEASILYHKGWCNQCWEALGPVRQSVVLFVLAEAIPYPLDGTLFRAVNEDFKIEKSRRERANSIRVNPKPKRLDLSEIDFGDISL